MLSSCSVMLALCDPVDCTMPGFPVLHRLPEFAQTHVHWVGDATRCNIQITTWYFCLFVFALKKKKKKVDTCLTPMCVFVLSHVWLFLTSWTVDRQTPLSTIHQIFQEKMLEWITISYPRDLPDPGIKPVSLVSYSLSQGKSRDIKDFNVKSETMIALMWTKIVSLF